MAGLLKRLQNGGNVVVAEGYLFEFERRGFLEFGDCLPVVVLDRPSAVRTLHEEFALAGSDVIEAFTYYGHREMMRKQGREGDLERLNRDALRIAREVADEYGILMAGNLSKTSIYKSDDPETEARVTAIFKVTEICGVDVFVDQSTQCRIRQYFWIFMCPGCLRSKIKSTIEWAVEGGADFIIAETLYTYGEALLALNAIKEFGKGLPAVITMTACFPDRTTDDVPFPEACKRLEDEGAAVVGINCTRGPEVMMPLIREIRKVCKGPIAALPVTYRTTPDQKTFQSLTDPITGKPLYIDNLDCVRSSREDIRRFAEEAKQAGVQYVGLCCGNAPNFTREIAEVYGRVPPASKFSCNMKKSVVWGESEEDCGEEMKKARRFMLNK